MHHKEPTYEAVEVGETFGPLEFEVDEHYLKSAVFSLDDYSDWYMRSGNELSSRLVPSAALARDGVALFLTKYNPNTVVGLHQTEEVWYHRPVPLGTRVTMTGRYVDKYQRRGKGYVVLDCEARDEHGNLLVRQQSTEIMRIPDDVQLGQSSANPAGRKVEGRWPEDRDVVPRACAGLAPGSPVRALLKRAYQDQMSVFSGCQWHQHNIHTDDRIAAAAGFKGTLAQGMMETCWMSEMLGRFYGPTWLRTGWIKTSFLKPVYAGDEITLRAVTTGVDADGRLEVEVWAENQDGLMTAAGWASAVVEP